MGKMSWIAYLAENGKREELMEEVSSIASASGKTAAEIADGFIEAVKTIKKNKDKPAYKNLNKIQKDMVKDATYKFNKKSLGNRITNKIKKSINKINRASIGIRDE